MSDLPPDPDLPTTPSEPVATPPPVAEPAAAMPTAPPPPTVTYGQVPPTLNDIYYKPAPNILLFIITILSVMMTGVDIPRSAFPADGSIPFTYLLQHIFTGWCCSFTMNDQVFSFPFFFPCKIVMILYHLHWLPT